MSPKEIFEKIKEGFGILNPQNIITDNDKKLLLEANYVGEESRDTSIEPQNSYSLKNEVDANLIQRTQIRFLKQELRKQKNLEQIFEKAEKIIDNEQPQSQEKSSNTLNEDWLSYYIENASKISDEQVQDLWAKILAGEIIKPKTFSKRTIDILLRLSSEEAQLFEKICGYIVEIDNTPVIINEEPLNSANYFTYFDIMRLGEFGLINSSHTNRLSVSVSTTDKFAIVYGEDVIIGIPEKPTDIAFQIFPLTISGIELFRITSLNRKYNYIKNLENYLENKYQNINWSICQILERDKKNIRYVKINMHIIRGET